jgi:hypothetical protein
MSKGIEIVTKMVPPDFAEPYMPEDGQLITSLIRANMAIAQVDGLDTETHMSMIAATVYVQANAVYHIAANSLKHQLEQENRTMMSRAGNAEVRKRALLLHEFIHKAIRDTLEEFLKSAERGQ